MKFDCKSLAPTQVLEVFNANRRTVEADLGDHTFDRHADHRAYMVKSKKQTAEMTRRLVGDVAWQRFVGASGRGWRVRQTTPA